MADIYNWEDNVKDFPCYERNGNHRWSEGFRKGWYMREERYQEEANNAKETNVQSS